MAVRNDGFYSLELPTTWDLLPRLHPPPAKWDKVEPVKTPTDHQTSRLKADIIGTGFQPPTPQSSACGLLVRSVLTRPHSHQLHRASRYEKHVQHHQVFLVRGEMGRGLHWQSTCCQILTAEWGFLPICDSLKPNKNTSTVTRCLLSAEQLKKKTENQLFDFYSEGSCFYFCLLFSSLGSDSKDITDSRSCGCTEDHDEFQSNSTTLSVVLLYNTTVLQTPHSN